MTNYETLSESELQAVIKKAEKALREKKEAKRKEILAQIYALAASIDVKIEIKESEKRSGRKGVKIPIKYRNPENPEEQWTGRGVTPKWLRAYLEAGRDKTEFEV